MTNLIDLAAARLEREKLIIGVAGLVSANCANPTADNVAIFASEVRFWNETRPDMFYADMLTTQSHGQALAWSEDYLGAIPGWRDALFGGRTQ